MRLFEVIFFLSCAIPALVTYGLNRWLSARHELWTLIVAVALTSLALGFGVHVAAEQINRSL